MRKGFTLLELIVVIIIIGILATLGFAQYTRMIERARGAEGRSVMGALRTEAAALWLEGVNAWPAGITSAATLQQRIGIATNIAGTIPATCTGALNSGAFFFSYTVSAWAATGFTLTGTRCITGQQGKAPPGPAANTLELAVNFATGTDTWGGTGGY